MTIAGNLDPSRLLASSGTHACDLRDLAKHRGEADSI
jgi:hypothetical protein